MPRRDESWKNEWKGMPEFIQEDMTSFRKMVIHFRSQEDFDAFMKLIGQTATPRQPSTWYPIMPPRRYADKRYVDEPE